MAKRRSRCDNGPAKTPSKGAANPREVKACQSDELAGQKWVVDRLDVPVSYLGIDIGTTVTKAALFDEQGKISVTAERPTRLEHPAPQWVEQHVDEVLASVLDVISDVVESSGAKPTIVALTGQGDGCWLVDDDGQAVRPAVSWMDGRASEIVSRWERDGTATAVYRTNGNALFPGAQASILRWLAENEPETLRKATTAGYCKDVIMQRLTGRRATDTSDASLPFGDGSGQRGYSGEALRLCEVEQYANLLAPIETPLPAAVLSPDVAARTGLAEGTPLTSGPFDLPACAAGAGVYKPGDGLLTLGTTLACQVLVDHLDVDDPPTGMHLATAQPGRWLRALPAMVGCASLDWALAMVGMTEESVSAAIESTQPGAGGVEVLPYLAPSGERAPFVDPYARGQITGLRLTTTREEVVRGVCEGIAFAARDCFDATALSGRLMVCGGGTQSRAWLQLFADVLQRPLYIAPMPEVGARGAVLSALSASGQSVDTQAWTAPQDVVEPNPLVASHYDDAFARYRQHQSVAQPLWTPA
jgi:erythritol kinase (D-erythritol 1-phosphate-forming)